MNDPMKSSLRVEPTDGTGWTLERQPTPQRSQDLTPAQTPAVTPNRDKEPSLAEPDRPPETPGAKQQPSEQQTTPAADPERPKRTIREPAYLNDYLR